MLKLLINIIFEKLHRFVYDYYYQSINTNFGLPTRYVAANKNNKLERYNEDIAKFYNWLCPYFEGWRENLLRHFPNKPKYQRYV